MTQMFLKKIKKLRKKFAAIQKIYASASSELSLGEYDDEEDIFASRDGIEFPFFCHSKPQKRGFEEEEEDAQPSRKKRKKGAHE